METVLRAKKDGVMEVLIYLLPMALALGLLGLIAFLWSLRNGQYNDLERSAWRAITDEDSEPKTAGLQAVTSKTSDGDRSLSLSDEESGPCFSAKRNSPRS
jgi:cbb3-type cytochrome oxidase maturation protein